MKKLVIMAGGFHPFHQGHLSLYNAAKKQFPDADVYVAATNDTSKRPFPFEIKAKLAQLAGVDPGHFIQVKSPFRPEEITKAYNPDDTELIYVRSEKDIGESPKPGGVKKDGSPAYLQPFNNQAIQPMSKHAYIAYLPTVEFAGGITSATEIRNRWPDLSEEQKVQLVNTLYPKTKQNTRLAANVIKLLNLAIQGNNQGINESQEVNEVSQDWNDRWRAGQQLADLFNKKYKKGNFTLKDLELAKSLVKVSGRAHDVGRAGYRKYTAGNILDDIVNIIREKDIAAGKTPELTRAPSTREMAKQIAQVTNGYSTWRNPTVWTTNYGDRYKDPKDHVEYSDEEAYNDAWQFLLSKGKQVHYKESGHLHTAIQIGSYLIEPSSRTKGYFSDNPETTHSISVRTVKSLGQRRQKQDITDQQAAALRDIAQTKNANQLEMIKAIFSVLQGEQEVKQVIAQSQKIDPRDKAKLDQIIAGAKNFKEPGEQGINESTICPVCGCTPCNCTHIVRENIEDTDYVQQITSEFIRKVQPMRSRITDRKAIIGLLDRFFDKFAIPEEYFDDVYHLAARRLESEQPVDETKKQSTQQKFEKHLKKHGYDVAEKSKYWDQKVKDIDAQIAAWDAEMKRRQKENLPESIKRAIIEGGHSLDDFDYMAEKKSS